MITVTHTNIQYDEELRLRESAGGIIRVNVEGHALFAGDRPGGTESGKGENIVCAAVSFSALNLVKSIAMIAEIRPDYTVREGFFELGINIKKLDKEKNIIIRVLLESFIIGILDMQGAYPDLIAVRFKTEN